MSYLGVYFPVSRSETGHTKAKQRCTYGNTSRTLLLCLKSWALITRIVFYLKKAYVHTTLLKGDTRQSDIRWLNFPQPLTFQSHMTFPQVTQLQACFSSSEEGLGMGAVGCSHSPAVKHVYSCRKPQFNPHWWGGKVAKKACGRGCLGCESDTSTADTGEGRTLRSRQMLRLARGNGLGKSIFCPFVLGDSPVLQSYTGTGCGFGKWKAVQWFVIHRPPPPLLQWKQTRASSRNRWPTSSHNSSVYSNTVFLPSVWQYQGPVLE